MVHTRYDDFSFTSAFTFTFTFTFAFVGSNNLALNTLQATGISFPTNEDRATWPLELVYSDICGPITPTSLGNARYFITFTDDFTRYCWIYSIPDKFKRWQSLSKTNLAQQSNVSARIKANDTSDTTSSTCKHKASPNSGYSPQYRGMIRQNAYGYDPPYASQI